MYTQALRSLTLPARSLRTGPGRYLLGPSGARLSADAIDSVSKPPRGRSAVIARSSAQAIAALRRTPPFGTSVSTSAVRSDTHTRLSRYSRTACIIRSPPL